MNLGHTIGSRVRQQIREPDSRVGTWHRIGHIAMERVRTQVMELDLVRYESWQTRNDERTCPVCGQLNGVVWREGEGFSPPAHDNCRCQRAYHHTEFRKRLIDEWRDVAVPAFTWEWRTR